MTNSFDASKEDSTYQFLVEQYTNGELEGGVAYQPRRSVSDEAPLPPTNLAALPLITEVDLTWSDVSTNESGFILQRSENDTTNFRALPNIIPADSTSFEDTDLTPNTTYCYRLKATNEFGTDSELSLIHI